MSRLHVLPALALMIAGAPEADAACFAPGTALPDRAEIAGLGQSGRDLAAALLAHDWDAARRLLDHDPALARLKVGRHHDMLSVAVASCEGQAIDLVAAKGAVLDGIDPGVPLMLALRATTPDLAFRLLKAGASPMPEGQASGPMATAIALNSPGAVRLLLDFRADPNLMEATGNRPLQSALDMEHFRIAELLLDRGADPWAIDGNGGNLGSSLKTPMLTKSSEEAAARDRLEARLARLHWPTPIPDVARVRALALAGRWPPVAGAKPVPDQVMALLRKRAERHR